MATSASLLLESFFEISPRIHYPYNLFANKDGFHNFVKHEHIDAALLSFISFNSPSEDTADGSSHISVRVWKHLIFKFLFELYKPLFDFIFVFIFWKIIKILLFKSEFVYFKRVFHVVFKFFTLIGFCCLKYDLFNFFKYVQHVEDFLFFLLCFYLLLLSEFFFV